MNTNKTVNNLQQIDEENLKKMQIDLHIAEYNALTTRCTYFTNIQNLILSVLVIWLTVMIGLWIKNPSSIIAWGTILGSQIFGILSAVLLYEEYNMIRYIESFLKPIINNLLNKKIFWEYQSFLISQRKESYKIWEFSIIIITGIIIITVSITRFPWDYGDFIGFVLNFLTLYVFGSKTYSAAKLRWDSWKIN